MNLAKIRSVVEHDSHYVVDDGVGKPFKVAKRGLSDATRAKITAIASGKLAGYNEGGAVEPTAEVEPARRYRPFDSVSTRAGDATAPDAGVERRYRPFESDALPPPIVNVVDEAAPSEFLTPSASESAPAGPMLASAPRRYRPFEATATDAVAVPPEPAPTPEAALRRYRPFDVTEPQPPAPVPVAPAAVQLPPENAFLPARPAPKPAPAPVAKGGGASTTALPAVPAMPAAPLIPAGEASPEFKAALEDQKAAAAALGEVRLKEADAAKAAAEARESELARIATESEAAKKAALDDYAAKEKAYRENEIDPNRMFGSMSTGRKVAAALSLFAGGFASAYTGKNYALDIFNKAIDDDIAAQKDKKNSQYNLYLRAGDDAKTAEAKARADVAAAINAKFEADAAKLLPEKAQADVKKAAADLRMQANNLLMAEIDRDSARKADEVLNPLRVQNEQARLVSTQYGMEADRARLGMQSEQIGLEKRRMGLAEREFNERKLSAQEARDRDAAIKGLTSLMAAGPVAVQPGIIENLLPKDVRERAVQIGQGQWTLAKSEKDREKADAAIAASDQIASNLDKLIEISKDEGRALLPSEAKARADVISKIVQMGLKDAFELGAFDKGSASFLEDLGSNPTKVFQTYARERLLALKSAEKSRLRSSLNSHLLRPLQIETSETTASEKAAANASGTVVRYATTRK